MAAGKVSTREIVLVVILLAAGIWYVWYLTGRGLDGGAKDAAAGALGAFEAGDAPRVRIDLLAGLAEPYDQNGRDLFKYSKRPPTAAELEAERLRLEAERRAREEALRKQREARNQRQQQSKPRPVTPPKPAGPRPPRISFKYIGYLGPKDDRIAVFEQSGELMLARVGETVQDQFRVKDIDYETVVVGYTDPKFEKLSQTLNQSR
jgi:hypothetical protein